ncbi:hypothetical protein TEU_06650 [Thermococcus eurythermalis]|uniref:Uncharacterized protein n=1 Tax=Thermococcus eurythermalis TaxID=1505907 RepID=A0A097QUA0_9EURY|nr:hypothetical protein [Thermococcus eurythermalis]AIU70029.1 hypothetical protein TEU_06650 [Thermococcus eurythermalis]
MGGEELRFTGNWFIDAGILGFVNLMEEVYGWDLEWLQRRIKEEPEKIYYGYFPLAYLFHHSVYHQYIKNVQDLNSKIFEVRKKLSELENSLNTLNKELSKSSGREGKKLRKRIEKSERKIESLRAEMEELFKKIDWEKQALATERKKLQEASDGLVDEILTDSKNNFENVKTLLVQVIGNYKLQIPKDHRNFFLYNPKKEPVLAFQYLFWLLKMDYGKLKEIKGGKSPTYERIPDSTINPFLYSPVEFPNVSYTRPLTTEQITKMLPAGIPAYIIFLSFFNAFQRIPGSYIMVYVPELQSCYAINKRLKVRIQSSNGNAGLFKLTWSAIIDEIVETKARFSLENLYIIEFENIENQKLKGVEYIGIPKLHASIILDDKIRDALNTSLPTGDSNIWLLGEFIKQKPLYPLISKHIWNVVRKNSSPKWRTSLYALAVDAKLRSEGNSGLFGRAFLDRPKRAAVEVKDFHRDMNGVAMTIKELSPEIGGKNLIHPLFSALRRHNRDAFVNTLLKALLQAKSRDKVAIINSYLFRRVLNNDSSWEDFALALVIGLVGGGGDASSGQDIVED